MHVENIVSKTIKTSFRETKFMDEKHKQEGHDIKDQSIHNKAQNLTRDISIKLN